MTTNTSPADTLASAEQIKAALEKEGLYVTIGDPYTDHSAHPDPEEVRHRVDLIVSDKAPAPVETPAPTETPVAEPTPPQETPPLAPPVETTAPATTPTPAAPEPETPDEEAAEEASEPSTSEVTS